MLEDNGKNPEKKELTSRQSVTLEMIDCLKLMEATLRQLSACLAAMILDDLVEQMKEKEVQR